MLGSALNEQGGGLGLYFLQEHGGIPPTPPFRRVLAGTDGIFGGDIMKSFSLFSKKVQKNLELFGNQTYQNGKAKSVYSQRLLRMDRS